LLFKVIKHPLSKKNTLHRVIDHKTTKAQSFGDGSQVYTSHKVLEGQDAWLELGFVHVMSNPRPYPNRGQAGQDHVMRTSSIGRAGSHMTHMHVWIEVTTERA
jgi:hypothetical protein